MKLVIASAHHPNWPKMDWVEQAARKDHSVRRSVSSESLPELLDWSDAVIFGQKSLGGRWPNVRPALQAAKVKSAYWWFDLMRTDPRKTLKLQTHVETFRPFMRGVDVVLVKEKAFIPEYRSLGINAHWVDQGCPENMPSVKPQKKQWDLLIWGQVGHYKERLQAALAAQGAGFSVAWAGGGAGTGDFDSHPWTMPFDLPKLASKAKFVLSCGVTNEIEGYWSDQFWMACGMGACVIRRDTPGLPDGPYLKYSSLNELVECLLCKDHEEIGMKCRQWVMENHTVKHRLDEVIALIAGVPDTKSSPSSLAVR